MQGSLILLRKKNGITQRKLAKELRLSLTAYRNKELGKTEFTLDEMFFLRDFFDMPLEQIFLPNNPPKREYVKGA